MNIRNDLKNFFGFSLFGFVVAFTFWIFGIFPSEVSIGVLTFPINRSDRTQDICNIYNIKITHPKNGYIISNQKVFINGTVSTSPPIKNMWLVAIMDSYDIVTYWPQDQKQLTFDSSKNTWSGVIYTSEKGKAAIAYSDENGQILFDYFRDVSDTIYKQNVGYPGISQLPKGIKICDEVEILKP